MITLISNEVLSWSWEKKRFIALDTKIKFVTRESQKIDSKVPNLSCGSGNQFRNRRCDDPPVLYGGASCPRNALYNETIDGTGIQQQQHVQQPSKKF